MRVPVAEDVHGFAVRQRVHGGAVGVAVDEDVGLLPMQGVADGRRVGVGDARRFVAGALTALPAQFFGDGKAPARGQAVVEALQAARAQDAAQALVAVVVDAEQVAVFEEDGFAAEDQAVAFGQEGHLRRARVGVSEEEIAVAVLVVNGAGQGGEGGGGVLLQGGGEVVAEVVVEEVAEDVHGGGIVGEGGEGGAEGGGDAGPFGTEMDVGEEVFRHGDSGGMVN